MKEPFFTIDERIETLCRQAEEQCAGIFRQIDDTADYNAQKVLAAFIKSRTIAKFHRTAKKGCRFQSRWHRYR